MGSIFDASGDPKSANLEDRIDEQIVKNSASSELASTAAAAAVAQAAENLNLIKVTDPRLPIPTEEDFVVGSALGQDALRIYSTDGTLSFWKGVPMVPVVGNGIQIGAQNGQTSFDARPDGKVYIPDPVYRGGFPYNVDIVHSVVIFGQSNPDGRGKPFSDSEPMASNVLQYSPSKRKLIAARAPLDNVNTISTRGVSFAHLLVNEWAKTLPPNEIVVIIPYCYGGTGIVTDSGDGCWGVSYAGTKRKLFAESVAFVQEAIQTINYTFNLAPSLDFGIFGIGEQDAGAAVARADFETALDACITSWRAVFSSPNMPFILQPMVDEWIEENATARRPIEYALADTPRRLNYTSYIKSKKGLYNYGDKVHYSRDGARYLGIEMGQAALDRARVNVSNTAISWGPLPPLSASATFGSGILSVDWVQPSSRANAFVVEYSIDNGAWVTATRSDPMFPRETVTGLTGTRAKVRLSSQDGARVSDSVTINATGV